MNGCFGLGESSDAPATVNEGPIPAETYVVGVDEAGRGPVLGGMVYGIAWCPISKKEELASIGFMDSKKLDDSKRDGLLDTMGKCSYLQYAVDVLEPQEISGSMLQKVCK